MMIETIPQEMTNPVFIPADVSPKKKRLNILLIRNVTESRSQCVLRFAKKKLPAVTSFVRDKYTVINIRDIKKIKYMEIPAADKSNNLESFDWE